MIKNEKYGVVYLTFENLSKQEGLLHACSTRIGGVSEGYLSSLNFDFREEPDHPEHVRENYRRMAAACGFRTEDMIFSAQTHTTNVRRVYRTDRGCGFDRAVPYADVDGLITNEEDCVLRILTADCVPVFFYDPVHRAIGLSHAGWRGTADGMAAATIRAMSEAYGTRAEDIYAAIGPSISVTAYEVSEDVAEHFSEEVCHPKENGKYMLDLWEANRQALLAEGVPDAQIEISGLCTYSHPELFFSHRYSKGKRGEMAAFISLSSSKDR